MTDGEEERLDCTPVGELTAEVMESLTEIYGEDCHISMAAVVVEVDRGDTTDLVIRGSDARAWVLEKFLDEATAYVERFREAAREIE